MSSTPVAPSRRKPLPIKWIALALLLAAGAVWISLSPGLDLHPAAFRPEPAMALEGPLAVNQLLQSAHRLAEGELVGPEDLALDSQGRVYGGTEDGKIVRWAPGKSLQVVAETGGRPLGLHFDAQDRLVIADAQAGLLRMDSNSNLETLGTEVDGLPFAFTDDLDIASDGSIYFSDASYRHDHHHYLYDLLEAKPHGRLLRWNPETGGVETLLKDLYFANGIALSQDESFVLVNETYRYRIRRYWLTGPKAGTDDIFIDHLPGFPDGISANRHGTFWVAMFTVRNPIMDRLHPHPWLKKTVGLLPKALWPKPKPYGLVIGLNEQAEVVHSLHDPSGETVRQVTSVEQVGGSLWLGTLHLPWMARYDLPVNSPWQIYPEESVNDSAPEGSVNED